MKHNEGTRIEKSETEYLSKEVYVFISVAGVVVTETLWEVDHLWQHRSK